MALDAKTLSLYLVTDPKLCAERGLLETVHAALKGGVRIVQLRDKTASTQERIDSARQLKPILDSYHAPLIINDDIDAAMAVDAEGVHVGQQDMDIISVRTRLGPDKIIGLSVTRPDQFSQVDKMPVDYIGAGPIHPTSTKPDHDAPIGFDGLSSIVRASSVPVVAIGGLGAKDCGKIFAARAQGMAVVSAICGQADPQAAAAALKREIERSTLS